MGSYQWQNQAIHIPSKHNAATIFQTGKVQEYLET